MKGNEGAFMYEIKLKMVREAVEGYGEGKTFAAKPAKVHELFKERFNDMPHEEFLSVSLSAKNEVIGIHTISKGTIDASSYHSRDVFAPALLSGAVKILLIHNHPAGDPTPSPDDIEVTQELILCSSILDIPIVDHVVIGGFDGGFVSMRSEGLVEFKAD
jgi:DNA repair protein RadC